MTTENADIDAIRQRADEYEATMQAFKRTPLMSSRYVELIDEIDALRMSAPEDRATLLAHVDEQAERVRTLEAALTILEREQHAYIATQTAFDDVWDAARKLRGDLTGDYTMEGGKDAIVIVIESARYTLRKQAADAGNGGA